MLDYDRIDVSKKSNDSLERIVCHYCCILFKKKQLNIKHVYLMIVMIYYTEL